MGLMRLSNIANYLTLERDLSAAVQFVALNACQSGLPCRFYVSRLNSDLTLHHIASFGFSEEFIALNSKFSLLTNPLLNQAIQSEKLLVRPRDEAYRREFKDLVSLDDDSRWETTIFMPLLPNYASTLSTQIKVEDHEESREYFGLLQSIFNLYIQRMGIHKTHNSGRVSKIKENRMGAKLSERQELILEMIKDGMTNSSIANRMGYSESLIRQESMAIYQKLGVDGRRDLVRSDLLDESSDDESHGIQT